VAFLFLAVVGLVVRILPSGLSTVNLSAIKILVICFHWPEILTGRKIKLQKVAGI